jgi:hypothetical protein
MTIDLRMFPGCRIVPGGPDRDPDTGVEATLVQTDDGIYAFCCKSTCGFISFSTADRLGRKLDGRQE